MTSIIEMARFFNGRTLLLQFWGGGGTAYPPSGRKPPPIRGAACSELNT